MKFAIFAAAVVAAASTPAFAQEGNFAGGHVEALVGYDNVDLNTAGVSNPDGVMYGVGAGYDFQAGKVVYGVEAELSDASTELKIAGFSVAKTKRDIYVGGRLGYAMGPALLYAKLGYTNARVEVLGTSDNGDGVRAGVGIEYKLGGNLFVKGEYRYSNYEADLERQQVVGGIGIRF